MENRKGIIWIMGALVVLLVYLSTYIAEYLKPYFSKEVHTTHSIGRDGHWQLVSHEQGDVVLQYHMDAQNAQKLYLASNPRYVNDVFLCPPYITQANVRLYASRMVVAHYQGIHQKDNGTHIGKWDTIHGKIIFDTPLFLTLPNKAFIPGFK